MSFKVSYDKDTLNLQKLGEIVYEKTDLADFRSNSDAKGLVDYTWQNASNNESVLTFDFKGKNIELEDLPYADISYSTVSVVRKNSILYGDFNATIANSDTEINDTNKYKITFNGKWKLPKYSVSLFEYNSTLAPTSEYICEIDLTKADMNNIVNAYDMFNHNTLTTLSLPNNFTGENIVTTSSMFDDCQNLTSLDLSSFTGESLEKAPNMFAKCKNLTNVDLRNFTGENLTSAYAMFYNCKGLNSLDLRNFTGEKLTDVQMMFYLCEKLASLIMKGSAINKIISLNSSKKSYLSLASGVTVEDDKTYRCTCTYGDYSSGTKITAVTEI